MNKSPNMNKSPKKLREEAAKLVQQAEKIEQELADPMHALAYAIHQATCDGNHAEGCAWDYEIPADIERLGTTRNSYLQSAHRLTKNIKKIGLDISNKQLIELVEIFKEVSPIYNNR